MKVLVCALVVGFVGCETAPKELEQAGTYNGNYSGGASKPRCQGGVTWEGYYPVNMEGSIQNDRFFGQICFNNYLCQGFDYVVYADGTIDGESFAWKGQHGEYHSFMDGKIADDQIRGSITFRVVDSGSGVPCYWRGLVLTKE